MKSRIVPALAGFLVLVAVASAAPTLIDYQGRLADAGGNPVNGKRAMSFAIYSAATGGTLLWNESYGAVSVYDGLFHVLLGSGTALTSGVFSADERWLQITVAGEVLTPRTRIASVAYALQAQNAVTANQAVSATTAVNANFATTAGSAPETNWISSGANIHRPSGNVGIGTPSPGGPLHVYRAADLDAFFEADSGDTTVFVDGADDAAVAFRKSGIDKGIVGYRTIGDYFYLWNGGYVVLKGGNLGVGEEAPATRLHVAGNVTVNQKILAADSGGLELATSNGLTRLFIADSGRVGLGTLTPGSAVHVLVTNGNADLTVDSYGADAHVKIDAATGTPAVEFLENHVTKATVGYSIASDYAYINEGGSNVVFDNGRVGIGTTAPSNSLTVNGSVSVSGPCYGTWPRPAYDSGWIAVTGSIHHLTHNVGGDVDNYVVDMQFKTLSGLVNRAVGLDIDGSEAYGGCYQALTTNSLQLIFAIETDFRIRIWTYK